MNDLFDWIRAHQAATWWLAVASALMFAGSLLLIPVLIARIPRDYFSHPHRPLSTWADRHFVVRALAVTVKNALGLVFVLLGVAMLVLPGQGVLCIVLGIVLLDFPGKFRLERWLVGQRPVLRSINWVRRRAGREPLLIE